MKSAIFISCLIFASASVWGMTFQGNSPESKQQKELWKVLSKKNFHIKKLEKIISSGVNLNCRNKYGDTPFLYAVRTYKIQLLEFLLKIPKVNIKATDLRGNTSLIIAAKHKELDIMKKLNANISYDTNDVLTFLSAYKNKQKWSNPQIQQYMNNKLKEIINTVNYKGNTPLITAVLSNNYKVTEYLIEHFADIDKPNFFGYTPLIVSVKHQNESLTKYLVTHGANINKYDLSGYTPLSIAMEKPNKKLIKYLIDHGADVNAKIEHQESPINFAIRSNNKKLIKYLVDHGADINTIDLNCYALLHYATKQFNPLLFSFLVELGAKFTEYSPTEIYG